MPNHSEIALPISGMSCISCASDVESALLDVSGVRSAKVNPTIEKATITFDIQVIETWDLVEAVRGAGYNVATESIALPIGGMTCISCVAHVEGALSDVPGVTQANVDLSAQKATVDYVPSIATLNDFKQAVFNAGYEVL